MGAVLIVSPSLLYLMRRIIPKASVPAPCSKFCNVPHLFIGAIICAIVIFKFVPLRQRLTFILAGLAGGGAGAVLWFISLGPRLLP